MQPPIDLTSPSPSPIHRPDKLEQHERMQLRTAAVRAKQVYPGPVGELISRELLDWEQFGYRTGGAGLVRALVDAVLKVEKPTTTHIGLPA